MYVVTYIGKAFHGGRSSKNVRHSVPHRPSTSLRRKEKMKLFGCNDCRSIFQPRADSTILLRLYIATHKAQSTSYGIPPITQFKAKHIDLRYHHIRELATNKKLEVQKVDTEVNIVDNMTKPLPYHCFRALRRQMGLQQAESEEVENESKVERVERPKRPQSPKEPKG